MIFIIRTDASEQIGIGHFTRCLALAEALIKKNKSVAMICRSLPDGCKKLCAQKGIRIYYLPKAWKGELEDAKNTFCLLKKLNQPISWLIVDSYELGLSWQKLIKLCVEKLMVIDDFADSKHDCDLLLSQNYPSLDYTGLVPENTVLCLGLKYVLLRQDFYHWRSHLKHRDGKIQRILISFGGSDIAHSTLTSLKILKGIDISELRIDVIAGDLNPDKEAIKAMCSSMPNVRYHQHTEQMAQLIANSDLALGSGGSTHWERCFLGLPAIVNIVAENQARTTENLEKEGRIINIGFNNDAEFRSAILGCLNNPAKMKKMSENCLSLIPYSPEHSTRAVDYLC